MGDEVNNEELKEIVASELYPPVTKNIATIMKVRKVYNFSSYSRLRG
jgi:hypothetical protein